MRHPLAAVHTQALDFWLARSSVAVIIVLQLLIVNKLSLGPAWLAPGLEAALLVPLAFATIHHQTTARDASTDAHWARVARQRRAIRAAALLLTFLITAMNLGSLLLLIRALVGGPSGRTGQSLLLDALNVWATNVIAFALWYWNLDRGGPASKGVAKVADDDFLFPQMTIGETAAWSPGFTDYLFLSFTNATAFSPTDTLPLTPRAKLLMMAESAISLMTLALVAARAVNILNQ